MKNGMLRKCTVVVAVTLGITFAGSAVASSSWSGPLVLGTGSGTQMEFDASGNGLAVWAQGTTLQAGRYDKASNSWTVEQLPGTPSGGSDTSSSAVTGLSLSVAANGDAIVAWSSLGGSEYVSGYRVAKNSWDTTPTLLASSSAVNVEVTATAITSTGLASLLGNHPAMATVAWVQCAAQCVSYAALWNGVKWGLPTQMGTSFGGEELSVGLGNTNVANFTVGQGNMVVVLSTPVTSSGADPSVYINTYDANNSGTWSASSPFWITNLTFGTYPQVAFDDSNNGIAVWLQNMDLMVRRYNASSGWSTTPVILDISAPGSPSLAVDPGTGNAVLAYTGINATAGTYTVCVSRFNAATASWSTPIVLGNQATLSSGGVWATNRVVAAIRGGNAVVGWLQNDSNNVATIFNVASWNGTSWGAAETLVQTTNTSEIYYPAVGIDTQGDVSALWLQNDGNVYLNYYGPAVPTL